MKMGRVIFLRLRGLDHGLNHGGRPTHSGQTLLNFQPHTRGDTRFNEHNQQLACQWGYYSRRAETRIARSKPPAGGETLGVQAFDEIPETGRGNAGAGQLDGDSSRPAGGCQDFIEGFSPSERLRVAGNKGGTSHNDYGQVDRQSQNLRIDEVQRNDGWCNHMGQRNAPCGRRSGATGSRHMATTQRLLTGLIIFGLVTAGSMALGCQSNDLMTEGKVGSGIPKIVDRSGVLAGKEVRGVKLETSARVEIRQGPTASLVVKSDDNLEELISTEVQGDRLVIAAKGSYTSREGVVVQITLSNLDAVELAGSGEIELKDINVDSLKLELTGSGMIKARGSAKVLTVSLTGSGYVKAEPLVADKVTAEVSGSGDVEVRSKVSLDATISGSGRLAYYGSPADVKKSVTGSGSIVAK